jgi:hypothetical protein
MRPTGWVPPTSKRSFATIDPHCPHAQAFRSLTAAFVKLFSALWMEARAAELEARRQAEAEARRAAEDVQRAAEDARRAAEEAAQKRAEEDARRAAYPALGGAGSPLAGAGFGGQQQVAAADFNDPLRAVQPMAHTPNPAYPKLQPAAGPGFEPPPPPNPRPAGLDQPVANPVASPAAGPGLMAMVAGGVVAAGKAVVGALVDIVSFSGGRLQMLNGDREHARIIEVFNELQTKSRRPVRSVVLMRPSLSVRTVGGKRSGHREAS